MRAGWWVAAAALVAACGGGNNGGGTGSTGPADGGTIGTGPVDGGTSTPTTFALTLNVTGQGTVSGAGQSCRDHCVVQVPAGALHLDASADKGWQFGQWSSACTSAACDLSISGELSLTVIFIQQIILPPPPVDVCAGLLPAALPKPVVPPIVCNNDCRGGTSDDGNGVFALNRGTEAQFGAQQWLIFDSTTGSQNALIASDQEALLIESQPRGFTLQELGDGNSAFTYSEQGQMISDVGFGGVGLFVLDPSGGFAVTEASTDQLTPAGSPFDFRRYDAHGNKLAGSDQVLSGSTTLSPQTMGMTLARNTLLLLGKFDEDVAQVAIARGLWVDPNGKPLGPQFTVNRGGTLQFLLDGGLLQRDRGGFFGVWQDGATTISPLPAWLALRAQADWLFPIGEGVGYAMRGGGACNGDASQIEVLAKNGKSCGCLAVPGVSATTTIGRDGSLIVPLNDHFELYPLLFHGTK